LKIGHFGLCVGSSDAPKYDLAKGGGARRQSVCETEVIKSRQLLLRQNNLQALAPGFHGSAFLPINQAHESLFQNR
jgi:hypothetical protein